MSEFKTNKKLNMKPITINQEALLFTGTSFSNRPLCDKGPTSPNKLQIQSEQLQEACWSGLLFDLLSDLAGNVPVKSFVWEVIPAKTFIRVNIGTAPTPVEQTTSIDPYVLLPLKNFN